MSRNCRRFAIAVLLCIPGAAFAGNETELTAKNFSTETGVVILQVNWGRKWRCAGSENAQLQALKFTRTADASSNQASLELEAPSKLFVEDAFVPYVLVLEPGEYALSADDVKVARSASDVGHLKASASDLIKDGKPIGGIFSVSPGEIVYIGHFGLDCARDPVPWRYYVDGRQEFERYVDGFRKKYPFAKDTAVQYRLFSTKLFGEDHSLAESTIK